MPRPRVTVVVPAYQAERTIARALGSLVAQTSPAWRAVVVDDGSTDRTAEIVERLAEDDERITLHRCEPNGGAAAARNVALALVDTEWVGFLDADDEWVPDRLERLLALAERTGADVIVDDVESLVDGPHADGAAPGAGESLFVGRGVAPDGEATLLDAALFVDRDLGVTQPLVTTRLVREGSLRFDEAARQGEDFPFFFLACCSARHPILVRDVGYRYHRTGASLSADPAVTFSESLAATRRILDRTEPPPGLTPRLRRRLDARVGLLETRLRVIGLRDGTRPPTERLRHAVAAFAHPVLLLREARRALGQRAAGDRATSTA